jgi:hypothetical protein
VQGKNGREEWGWPGLPPSATYQVCKFFAGQNWGEPGFA